MSFFTRLIAVLIFAFASSHTFASDQINTLEKDGLFSSYEASGTAIRGYDTVAYFTLNKATKGNAQYSVEWNNANWLFSSQENADLFTANPEKYAPQYGGYCAYGVAQGYLVKIEGDQWTINNGKLYLNYDKGVQKKWLKDKIGYIDTADSLIPKLLGSN